MAIGLVGRKAGMTRVFTESGESIAVTVLEVSPNRVTQVKNSQVDGYTSVQVTTGVRKASRVNKAAAGHFAKAKVEAGRGLWEFRVEDVAEYALGQEITTSVFEEGQKVDVSGTSQGKGFAGTIKRWNFAGQRNSHGNSLSHRVPGSIGQCQDPGRVFKGKKMTGHMGAVKRTALNLEIVRIDAERNIVLVKGAVPGAKGGNVIIKPSVKAKG
ncbi:50S ribosomal protein L3 [Wohlfahrtiimonas populi]|jgi:large subunit ribosomal protein L3|uniref:50S ribosomal protein L3 n=1 Tax=Wohlfahrtiimonas populi TaxID=1940240 RepID=UPI00098D4E90|nr:50S ribosomal protein L3 [Wohlfahrtiimonas populi]